MKHRVPLERCIALCVIATLASAHPATAQQSCPVDAQAPAPVACETAPFAASVAVFMVGDAADPGLFDAADGATIVFDMGDAVIRDDEGPDFDVNTLLPPNGLAVRAVVVSDDGNTYASVDGARVTPAAAPANVPGARGSSYDLAITGLARARFVAVQVARLVTDPTVERIFVRHVDGDPDDDSVDTCTERAVGTDPHDADTDGDGMGDRCDRCLGDGVVSDADGDGICQDLDLCFGDDATGDSDDDATCDDSDACPLDPDDDVDADGVCGDVDRCIGDDATGDSDGDMICDDLDRCTGNDASGDVDGDGVCDDLDNCPLDPNPAQTDDDGDALGNACETDSDGDGVDDDVDNCPALANGDQADTDADGAGDVCDDDDDGDGVGDHVDVCALIADPHQTDTDGDGLGDACDGDDDADGIADAQDLCPGTPVSAVFDAQGCGGAQQVQLSCGQVADYARPGRYLFCVIAEAQAGFRNGLLTRRERALMVRDAALATLRELLARR